MNPLNKNILIIFSAGILAITSLGAIAEFRENLVQTISLDSKQEVDPEARRGFLDAMNPEAEKVLRFWFEQWDKDMLTQGKGLPNRKWYGNRADGTMVRDEIDRIITEKFSDLFNQAVRGELDWNIEDNPYDSLAYILLTDQFPRHIYRGKAEAYKHDSLALKAAKKNIEKGFYHYYFTGFQKLFVVAPLVHDEDLASQQLALLYVKQLNEGREHPYEFLGVMQRVMDHYQMILMFGRFPHRNAGLGRQNTERENLYLSKKGSHGFIDGSKW